MTKDNTDKNIVSNEKINPVKLERAKKSSWSCKTN